MSNVLFTGGATPSGGFLVSKLRGIGDKVFTVGKGDDHNTDFRFLDLVAAEAAVQTCVSVIGAPDVIVHNARIGDPGNLNHILYANINARIFLDRAALNAHAHTQTPFRSIHILGWGPEWADARAEIQVSLAAQQAIPATLVARVKPLAQARVEYLHKLELQERKHKETQDLRRKAHDVAEAKTAEWHKKRKVEYAKKHFQPDAFCDTMEPVWVPTVDAVLLTPHPDHAANGLITRESLWTALLEAIELPHETGKLTTIIITK